ncbi:MAG: 30S ribosomal protein S6 [Clostridia bacterium]|jgi:small subunit ribosomal protein S6|nr:30S ribosomal protein S6 [Clostridia bacterium]
MNEYENVIIIKSDLSKEETSKVILKIENNIRNFAEITKKDDLGIKKLAYEIRKNNEGHYLVYQFQVEEKKREFAIREIERFYRITDEVIKFLIIKL